MLSNDPPAYPLTMIDAPRVTWVPGAGPSRQMNGLVTCTPHGTSFAQDCAYPAGATRPAGDVGVTGGLGVGEAGVETTVVVGLGGAAEDVGVAVGLPIATVEVAPGEADGAPEHPIVALAATASRVRTSPERTFTIDASCVGGCRMRRCMSV
ncbi:MAG: hypothetical protein WCI61_03180 [Chloroflexota bacterium]